MLDKDFLDLLACPKCKGRHTEKNEAGEDVAVQTELEYRTDEGTLIYSHCRLKYTVSEDDIPNFLIEEAVSF